MSDWAESYGCVKNHGNQYHGTKLSTPYSGGKKNVECHQFLDCNGVVVMNCNYDGGHGGEPNTYVDHHIWFVYNHTVEHACDYNSGTGYLQKVQSADDCLEICQHVKSCTHWTYYSADRICFLKDGDSNPIANSQSISGNADSNFLIRQNGVEYDSNNLGYSSVSDQDLWHGSSILEVNSHGDCSKICSMVDDCDGWTFDNRDGAGHSTNKSRCFLKFGLPNSCKNDAQKCLISVPNHHDVVSGYQSQVDTFSGFTISTDYDPKFC